MGNLLSLVPCLSRLSFVLPAVFKVVFREAPENLSFVVHNVAGSYQGFRFSGRR